MHVWQGPAGYFLKGIRIYKSERVVRGYGGEVGMIQLQHSKYVGIRIGEGYI